MTSLSPANTGQIQEGPAQLLDLTDTSSVNTAEMQGDSEKQIRTVNSFKSATPAENTAQMQRIEVSE
jgi:hypothetical protein